METANGIIETDVFDIDIFISRGLTKEKFQMQVYDFLPKGFFLTMTDDQVVICVETKFCIDTRENAITFS